MDHIRVSNQYKTTFVHERLLDIPTLHKDIVYRKTHKNLVADSRLITQNGLDVRLEKIKRQKHDAKVVNGKFYPQPTRYGYRLTGLPHRSLTLQEMREFVASLTAIVNNERE
jgi:hypothetical protein